MHFVIRTAPMPVRLLMHESKLLVDNPLGDSPIRELGVYLPPGYEDPGNDARYPLVLMLSGYMGAGPFMLQRGPWVVPLQERLDRLIRDGVMAPAIVLFPDCFTRYGGSQYVDSPAIGRYLSYLCDELIPVADATFRTRPRRESRAVVGKSSGGFGALHVAFERPELFAAVGCHAGDSAFELNYQTELWRSALQIEKVGGSDGIEGFLRWFDAQPQKSQIAIETMSNLCSAAAWSPNDGPYGYGRGFDLPVELGSAKLRDDVWQRWLAFDPVRRVEDAAMVDRLRSLAALFLDAGRDDEYGLQYGMRQLARKLDGKGVPLVHEEFDGGHRNTNHRYERSIPFLVGKLQ